MQPNRSTVELWARSAIEAARRPRSDEIEDADWQVRNWCEIAAILIATDNADAVRLLAAQVEASQVRHCSERFALRLQTLGKIAGLADVTWPCGIRAPVKTSAPSLRHLTLLEAFADYAESVRTWSSSVSTESDTLDIAPEGVSALIQATSDYRIDGPITFIGLRAASVESSLWRRWSWFPSEPKPSPLLLIPMNRMSREQHTVWTGIHDATHILHLLALEHHATGPAEIEFNDGLMVAESLAMSVEVIAASAARELDDRAVGAQLWRGFVERISRFNGIRALSERATPTVTDMSILATVDDAGEFATLPTLASAYSVGVLELASRGFSHPLVPASLGAALRSRWQECMEADPAIKRLTRSALECST